MKINQKIWLGLLAITLGWGAVGCKPKTTGQKIEEKVEDAGHEAGQALERTGENVKDATK